MPLEHPAWRDRILTTALRWLHDHHAVAIATVVRTWGSSPRPIGSQLAVREDGAFEGSVSGGCVEGAVIAAAGEVLRTHVPQTLHFGVSDESAFEVGLACGGEIDVLITPVTCEALEAITRWEERHATCHVEIDPITGTWQVRGPAEGPHVSQPSTPGWVEHDSGPRFSNPHAPPLRLVVIGAVHIATALTQVGLAAGYEVIIVDPRQAFAAPERFPGASVLCAWPSDALCELGLDERTALVALTHDPKIDDPALVAALRSPAFYVGALGSRKTHRSRCERLGAIGFAQADLDRVHGPVGLPIGARSPAEIAISIAAEITARLRQGPRRRISAVVLAAGTSTRMGPVNKLLHPIDGVPMLARVLDAACTSRVDDIVVVTGHDDDAIRRCIGERRVRVVHNARYAEGMSTSVRVGIDAVADADGALVLLGDMPWIEARQINALIAACDPALACVPVFEGRRGNPVLWGRDHFPALRALTGDRGARDLIEGAPSGVRLVEMDDAAIHRDVDTLP